MAVASGKLPSILGSNWWGAVQICIRSFLNIFASRANLKVSLSLLVRGPISAVLVFSL